MRSSPCGIRADGAGGGNNIHSDRQFNGEFEQDTADLIGAFSGDPLQSGRENVGQIIL